MCNRPTSVSPDPADPTCGTLVCVEQAKETEPAVPYRTRLANVGFGDWLSESVDEPPLACSLPGSVRRSTTRDARPKFPPDELISLFTRGNVMRHDYT
jgi:hypothetical protein